MSNTHALTTLLNLAEEAAEEAAKVLAQVRQTHTDESATDHAGELSG